MVHPGNEFTYAHSIFFFLLKGEPAREYSQLKGRQSQGWKCVGQRPEMRSRGLGAQAALLNNGAFHLRPEAKTGVNMMKEVEVRIWRPRSNSYPGRANSTCKAQGQPGCQVGHGLPMFCLD